MLIRKWLSRWMAAVLVVNQFRPLHEPFAAVELVALVGTLAGMTPNVAPEISLMNKSLWANVACVRSFT